MFFFVCLVCVLSLWFLMTSVFSEVKSDPSTPTTTPLKRRKQDAASPTTSSRFGNIDDIQNLYASAGVPPVSHGSSSSRIPSALALPATPLVVTSSDEEVLPVSSQPSSSWFDPVKACMVRTVPGQAGQVEEAAMQSGPNGFLLAHFGTEQPWETEVPNTMLGLSKPVAPKAKPKAHPKTKGQAKAKAKPEAKPKAKPKAKPEAKAKASAAGGSDIAPNCQVGLATDSHSFRKMWYIGTGKAAILQLTPNKGQLCQFGGKDLSKTDLYDICDQAIRRLSGRDLKFEDCKDWCHNRYMAALKR